MFKKAVLLLLIVALASSSLYAQSNLSKEERMKWWREARFGMFIHFGVYAQMAGEYRGYQQAKGGAEWIMNRMKVPVEEYRSIARQFNPVKFDADEWVKAAKDAGMKYIVITAKHHDGFALFDSKASDWDITDATPYGKDLLKPLAEACKRHGMKLGFYYSQAQDWVNPGGSAARKEMREGWPNPDSTKIDAYTKANLGHWDPLQETKSFDQYIDQVAVPQLRELMTNYGEIAVLWWDTPTRMTDDAALKFTEILKLQPQIITNDRLKRPNFPGDTRTPEQKIPDQAELDGKDWETCMTMNRTWGYRKTDDNWKSAEALVRNLVESASKGGNYLLNVGPKPDGSFPQESVERLQAIGSWMKVNSEAIYATKKNPLAAVDWGCITRKDNQTNTVLYLTVFDWPKGEALILPQLKSKVVSAAVLGSPLKVNTKAAGGNVYVSIPGKSALAIAPVIRLEVEGHIDNIATVPASQMKTGELD
ncbi:alpha-L-fucosidase [Arcticibacter sp.]|jgi:alpha-L-fucosidase|uniref:alpha-L-fucosidase n=1 Tax=Arcticibacter sp. TaxID=1872630 RepID=UPI0038905E93